MTHEIDKPLGIVESLPKKIIKQEVSPLSQEDWGDANEHVERDYEYQSKVHYSDLDSPKQIGDKAAERAISRLNPNFL